MRDTPAKIIFHKRATVALDALSIEEKSLVFKAIEQLSILGLEPSLRENVRQFQTDDALYLLRVKPNLRVIFRSVDKDEIEILDILMKERLELFAKKGNNLLIGDEELFTT